MIEAAAEAGKTNDLKSIIESLDTKTFPEADILSVWLAVQSDDEEAEALVAEWFKDENRRKRYSNSKLDYQTNQWTEMLIYRTCIRKPDQYREICEKHRDAILKGGEGLSSGRRRYYGNENDFSSMIRRDYEKFRATILGSEIQPETIEPLKYWTPSDFRESITRKKGTWTVSDNNQLMRLGGSGTHYSWMNYPITGDFKFSCEVLSNGSSSSDISFGGVSVGSLSRENDNRVKIRSITGNDAITRRTKAKVKDSTFQKVTVEVKDGVLKHYLDGMLLCEEKLVDTYPWLVVWADAKGLNTWRNPSFEGSPKVVNEVQLVIGDRLEGWRSIGKDTQIEFRKKAEPKPKDKDGKEPETKELKPEEYDWHAKDGVLYGKANEKAKAESDSLISYRRPMARGDQLSYEFRYEPGKKMANPTIGSVVIALNDGAKAQELMVGDKELSETSNYVNILESPHALAPISLKKDDWNRVV